MTRLRRLTGLHSPVTPRDERPAVDVVRAPHVVAGLHAATVLILGLAAVSWSSERLVSRHIYDLARSRYAQKDLGLVVQKVALRHSDVLPLYGSSEIDRDSAYHARELFADAPTGFSVLTVAGPGTPVFETLETLIALGRDLRGKKVVVSLSPPMFLLQNGAELDGRYAGNFSPLHALRLVLSRDVSFTLRRQLAARLVSRPFTVARNGVLEATANIVARDSPKSRILFLALLPLALYRWSFSKRRTARC
jgi:poly-D-alanine transfer protein DltD